MAPRNVVGAELKTRSQGEMIEMAMKRKASGAGLEMRSFNGEDGNTYLVFRTPSGAYHTFVEVEAKEAARQCGAAKEGSTRNMWGQIWKPYS